MKNFFIKTCLVALMLLTSSASADFFIFNDYSEVIDNPFGRTYNYFLDYYIDRHDSPITTLTIEYEIDPIFSAHVSDIEHAGLLVPDGLISHVDETLFNSSHFEVTVHFNVPNLPITSGISPQLLVFHADNPYGGTLATFTANYLDGSQLTESTYTLPEPSSFIALLTMSCVAIRRKIPQHHLNHQ